jgi:Lysylphosphatidylglycerol synthase TM region
MGALGEVIETLSRTVTDAALGWLALGVLLHVGNQIVRGRGWFAIMRRACPDPALRRRDAIGAWMAGAGAGGVVSVRGGDAVRVLLLGRRLPDTRASVVAGTLVAEAAGDALIGIAAVMLAVALGAAPAIGLPDTEIALVAAAALLAVGLAVRIGMRSPARAPRLRSIASGVVRGCEPLTQPGTFARYVLPWQVASRLFRGAAIFCFLAAFHLPVGMAAVLLVMLAQSGGRLLPLAPFSGAAAVAILTTGFAPATGTAVGAGEVAAFMIGMSTVLTIAGALLAVAIICASAGPGALAGMWRAVRPRRAARAET